MATTDLNPDHVTAGAEALQREDWEGNHPLIHYVPAAETVLAAVADLPKRQITTVGELEQLETGSMLQDPYGHKIAVMEDYKGDPKYCFEGKEESHPAERVVRALAPLTVLFEAEP